MKSEMVMEMKVHATRFGWAAFCLVNMLLLQGGKMIAQSENRESFSAVVKLVQQHSQLIVLQSPNGQAAIAVWPAMQGRVLTSTAEGPGGHGFGWVNNELIASGKVQPHIQAVGGEDRFWLGPEGGQFSLYFAKDAPFDLAHWFTPPLIDTEAFDLAGQTKSSVKFTKTASLTNYSGTTFDLRIDREVRLLSSEEIWDVLKVGALRGVKVVGYETNNSLTNISARKWEKNTGLLSIWILGQFQSSPKSTIILPFRKGGASELGIAVNADYFGAVPADRLAIGDNHALFRADANYRSKLGLSPQRALGVVGSYDAQNHVLTIVRHSMVPGDKEYVNSAWKLQDDPFRGDVANCYNDGPPAPGKPQLGSFYELESSSPARELAPGQSVKHIHRTIHLVGSFELLDQVAKAVLGVGLSDVNEFMK
jgi:hypothetical protein